MVDADRGQLILVGAIAIALILLGLVLIVNTALFTQVVGSEGTVESAKEGGVSGQEVGDGIAAFVAEENRNDRTVTSSDLDDLEEAMTQRSLESSGSFVSLEYESTQEHGRYIEQSSDDLLTHDGSDWSPVEDGDVGEFLVTLDTEDSAGGRFQVRRDPGDPESKALDVSVTSSNEIDLSGAGASECSDLRLDEKSVTIDLRHGVVHGDNRCQFELFDGTSPPYEIAFDGGNDVTGTYAIATNQTTFSIDHPGGYPIIWSFEYRFTYESTDATVESDSRVIDVYD